MIPFPSKKYNIILADPPWHFNTYSKKGQGRSASRHYNTMSLQEIKDLPVKDLSDKDCILFLWVTDPYLKLSMEVIESWGFTYKTVAFTWVKQCRSNHSKFHMGQGFWTRANTELCLLATKGKPKRIRNDIWRLIVAPIREHSRKPDEAYIRIEKLMGDLPRIELFARNTRNNWDSWGDEL